MNAVKVTLIKRLGRHKVGEVLDVHPNMKLHLQKHGYVESEQKKQSTVLSEAKPIILTASEPVKIIEIPEKTEVKKVPEVKKIIKKKPSKKIK